MKNFVLPVILMLALLSVLAGCEGVKDSGSKSEKGSSAKSGDEIDELRFSNRQMKKKNEALNVTNAELQLKLSTLERRDEQLTQKISDLKTDLKQRKLLNAGLLEDKKQLTAQLEKLQTGR